MLKECTSSLSKPQPSESLSLTSRGLSVVDMELERNHDLHSRFGHLLQPIRDLTKNWDVDVASQLEEYLEEVRMCVEQRVGVPE